MCIMKCKKRFLPLCTLILVSIDENGSIKQCKPCDMCQHIIKKYKIRRVVISSQKKDV